jgi:mannose-6-phosphate isomerase
MRVADKQKIAGKAYKTPQQPARKKAEESAEYVRPWGRYDILDEGAGFKVKRITVDPGKRLSYQRHAKRSERWVVVQGSARVTLDGTVSEIDAGAAVHVLIGMKHRVENIGPQPLVFIEVQAGDYLEEDDIERFADDFGRQISP